MKLFNTLSRKIEEFKPLEPPKVGMYTCGPTVYDYAHIGNFRTCILSDIVRRSLNFLGYQVSSVMNITDVGHLTSEADTGEDKLEKGAKREGKTAWDIAKKYTEIFLEDIKKVNILPPTILCKATEHIQEQIELVKKLEAKGYTYKTSDGLYFDTSKFKDYGQLAQLDIKGLKEGARVEKNPEKKNVTDFALWKFSPKDKKRDMEWSFDFVLRQAQDFAQGEDNRFKAETYKDSKGKLHVKGMGFPGWHLECSSMSMKYLGETLDIHLGGVDLIPVHHTNEIAQSEAATGKKFVNFWLHGEFVLVDGEKMSKSKGNFYNLKDIEEKGFNPLALRYLYLTAHYRSQLNFTWESLKSAQTALEKLYDYMAEFRLSEDRVALSEANLSKIDAFREKFKQAISNDLDFPQALAIAWEVAKSNLPRLDKYELLVSFDEVLGLDLAKMAQQRKTIDVSEEVKKLVQEREFLRKNEKWLEADEVRKEIEAKGFMIEDTPKGPKLKPKKNGRQG